MLQVRLPAEFLVEYHTKNTRSEGGMNSSGKQNERAGTVVLCTCLGEVHKDILLWGRGPPCLLAHSKHCSWTVCSILKFSSVNLVRARVFT
jgi:hypothetical protein